MGHPLAWPKKTYFFPIGATHPRHLSNSTVLAPEYTADVLLLGCGGPRSILYTAQADLGARL